MGVGADDEAGAAVEVVAEGLLLAGRLGVDVDHDGVGRRPERAGGDLALHGGERIVHRVEEDAAHHVDHQHAGAPLRLDHRRRRGRACRGDIRRPHQPRLAGDKHQRLALVEAVIAERHRVGAGLEQLVADRLGDAEAAGGVLAVDHDAVEAPALAQAGQVSQTTVRPERPTTSPRKSSRIGQAAPAQRITPASVITNVERPVMRLGRNALHLLGGEADADGQRPARARTGARSRRRSSRGRSRCVGRAVEGGERHDQGVRFDRRQRRVRLAEAEAAGDAARRPGARRKTRPSGVDLRQRHGLSAGAQPSAAGACRPRCGSARRRRPDGASASSGSGEERPSAIAARRGLARGRIEGVAGGEGGPAEIRLARQVRRAGVGERRVRSHVSRWRIDPGKPTA